MTDEVIFILGKRGSGKSTLAKRVLSRFNRIIVFDPLEEYHSGIIVQSMQDFFSLFSKPRDSFTIICRFNQEDEDAREREYEYAARAAWELGNVLLVLEECEQFITSTDRYGYINYLISFGRHKNVSLLAIGRRPAEIPIRFRANYTSLAAFRTTEPADLDMLERYGIPEEEILALDEFKYAFRGKEIE